MKKKKYLYAGIIIGMALVFLGAYLFISTQKENAFGRATQGEYLIFDGIQGLTSCSFDGGDDTILPHDPPHGLVVGDVIMFNTASATLGESGLSEATKYFVVTASLSTAFEISTTKGGTAADLTAGASTSGGDFFTKEFPERSFNVENYEHIMLSINTEEGASLSFKVLGSLENDVPSWYADKSTDNRFEHLSVYDVQNIATISGDTGLRVDDTDTNRMFLVYPATALKWITVISENYASGSVDVRFRGAE